MANTFQKLGTGTVTTTSSTISFTNIPSTFNDLLLMGSVRDYSANQSVIMRLNNSSSNIYSGKGMYRSGAAFYANFNPTASSSVVWYQNGSPNTASVFSNISIYIARYASSAYKVINLQSVGEQDGTNNDVMATAHMWSNTAAITSIELGLSYQLSQYSTITLYGIKNT